MNASYLVRLLLLSGEVSFLVYFSFGFLLKLATPGLVRRAEHWHPNRAANLMAWLRMIPALGSAAALAICLSAYLLLEVNAGLEKAGSLCLVLASASLCLCLACQKATGDSHTRKNIYGLMRWGHQYLLYRHLQ